jgi:hypothetical protein
MSESFQAETTGKPGFTRRRFIIGGVGVSAVAAIGGTTVRAADHDDSAADHDGA